MRWFLAHHCSSFFLSFTVTSVIKYSKYSCVCDAYTNSSVHFMELDVPIAAATQFNEKKNMFVQCACMCVHGTRVLLDLTLSSFVCLFMRTSYRTVKVFWMVLLTAWIVRFNIIWNIKLQKSFYFIQFLCLHSFSLALGKIEEVFHGTWNKIMFHIWHRQNGEMNCWRWIHDLALNKMCQPLNQWSSKFLSIKLFVILCTRE